MKSPDIYDLAVIGGGINGCGIARDAAGRGLSVMLCEQGDLASGTSSASTKLIHGGLRYLEYYEFRLVREALKEREVLLRAAPHIIWPLRFILPHHRGLRPAWLIRLGLFIYDHLGNRELLPGTTSLDLRNDPAGEPLKHDYAKGFEYSDCWVMDGRLVSLNAVDAAEHGARIRVRTECLQARRAGDHWELLLEDRYSGEQSHCRARVLVNATGPWMDEFLSRASHEAAAEKIRMVKGSHIIVPRLFEHAKAYLFQNADNRIIFAIPYEKAFTLIGTTDVDYHGDPGAVAISPEETDYLCSAASEYFKTAIVATDVVHAYAGVRPLFDDGASEAKAATRDYLLKMDTGAQGDQVPMISIYGGKITTYRKLAESVLQKAAPFLPPDAGSAWTESAALPGGDFAPDQFDALTLKLLQDYPFLENSLASRLVRTYGTRAWKLLGTAGSNADLGCCFGHDLHEKEVRYLAEQEWAREADDILWRRTTVGLFLSSDQHRALASWLQANRFG